MTLSKEVKVGLLALVAGIILYIGFNFLKGVDFFSPTNKYYIIYKDVDGLTPSNPVTLNGMTVGRVSNMKMITSRNNLIVVEVDIDDNLAIGDCTYAFISNTDLLGGKSIDLKLGKNTKLLNQGDTLKGFNEKNITEALTERAMPIMANLDSTVVKLNQLFGDELGNSVKNTLSNFEVASGDLKAIMSENRGNLKAMTGNMAQLTASLNQTEKELRPLLKKMNNLADSLNDLELKRVVNNANNAMTNLNAITGKINKGEGSLGAMVNDKSFYENLNKAIKDFDKLAVDLKNNPRHYFSPLGKKPKGKDQAPPQE